MANVNQLGSSELLYFDDLHVGQRFVSGTHQIDEDDIKTFAKQFDPQPFHVDAEAAKTTFFEGLVASGWQTAALTMKLRVEGELQLAGGWIGLGVDSILWPSPVRPGDRLTAVTEIVEARESMSKPQYGVIKVRTTTLNQNEQPVQMFVGNLIVLRRPVSSGKAEG